MRTEGVRNVANVGYRSRTVTIEVYLKFEGEESIEEGQNRNRKQVRRTGG
jgi:hypothetical protein